MKIELISPFMGDRRNIGESFQLPQMSLALLAALTPTDMDVSIGDELVEPVDFDNGANLVGITVNTQTAVRAYEIADAYRTLGVPVVLGGIHPTVAQKEAIQHADALVIGEAETVWGGLLEDLRTGHLRPFYRSDVYPSLSDCPHPRRGLFKRGAYQTMNLIQTTRGCPYRCHFCSVSTMYGEGVRLRPLQEVIGEIETLEDNHIFFVDDNIAGRASYAKALLERLIPLRRKWIGQASVTVARHRDMVGLLRKSGCEGLFVGFETTSIDCLKEVGKTQNVHQDYFECIKRLHDNGISVLGSFIVGFDGDDRSCFEKILEFIWKAKIDVADISTLTPYPGTRLYERLRDENRLVDERWWLRLNSNDVVYHPRLMTREDLREGRIWALKELYKLYPTVKRCLGRWHRRSFFGNMITWKVNMGYRTNAFAIPNGGKKWPHASEVSSSSLGFRGSGP
jgi:radical SAM superfamily enzyme YgiQ (UPF0313 family)